LGSMVYDFAVDESYGGERLSLFIHHKP
jgi:hypothetical protein